MLPYAGPHRNAWVDALPASSLGRAQNDGANRREVTGRTKWEVSPQPAQQPSTLATIERKCRHTRVRFGLFRLLGLALHCVEASKDLGDDG